MPRRSERDLGLNERLLLYMDRYGTAWRAVRNCLAPGWGNKDRAYEAASRKLGMRYDTVRHHYLRMQRSIAAAEAAGINVDLFKVPPIEERVAEVDQFFDHAVIDRKQQQESMYWDDVSEELLNHAFTENDRKQLSRLPRAFAQQLARERLELIALRKLTRKGKKQ